MRHPSANGLLALITLMSPVQSQPQSTADQATKISVNVDLAVLHSTLCDGKGHFASNLSKRDFDIYADGVQQTVRLFHHEIIPATIGLVIDHSGSMRRKLEDVIAAARTFILSSNPDDEIFVVHINENVAPGLAGGILFSNRLEELQATIRYIVRAERIT